MIICLRPLAHRSLLAGLLALVWVLANPLLQAGDADIRLGLQTWTLRNLKFDQMVEFAVKHGIKDLQIIPNHLNPDASQEELQQKKSVLEKHGLRPYTFGVAGTSMDFAKNRKLFEFAKFMGMKLIVVEPGDFRIWDNLEALAKEFDIQVAVHNHGIRSLYGNPAVVKNIVQHRDSRIGVCMDIGWITAAGFDAAKVFRDYNGRVFDLHLKDKKVEPALGDTVATDAHIGQGSANMKGLIAELQKANWKGVMAIETDSQTFALNPSEFVTNARKFLEANVSQP